MRPQDPLRQPAVPPPSEAVSIAVAGAQTWLDDVRELFGMVPRHALGGAFERFPRAVRDRTVSAVLRGTPLRWALPYAITRGIRASSWLLAR